MKSFPFIFPIIAISRLIAQEPVKPENVAPDFSKMKVDQIYQNLCSSCHGVNFEGGLGGSLVDGQWKHGSTDREITKSILEGNPTLGMTPFKNVLDEKQVRGMVIFLREQEKKQRSQGVEFPRPKPGEVTKTQHESYTIEVLTEGLKAPWAIAFLTDGKFLVTEKGGALRMIDADGKLNPEPIKNIPAVAAFGQGGLMEVATHPDYKTNGWIYLGLSDPHPDDLGKTDVKKPRALTAVFRGKIKDNEWVENQVIWRSDAKYYTAAGVHFGTRFVFKDGYLFFPVGERGGMMESQDPRNAKGKFYRIHDDGKIPLDNPKFDGKETHPGLWSIGHRNPQGVALDPRNGDIWSTEHGPRGGDELNFIQAGKNYGWPAVTLGMNYNGTPITNITEKEGVENPVTYWVPSIAVCGLDFYSGDAFPKWKNDLLVGSLRQQEIQRLRIIDRKVTEQEVIMKNIGRIRDVATGPDGFIYVLLNQPDHLVRLKPAK